MEATFWDESSLNNSIKCEGNLNFSTVASEDDEFGYHKKKLSRDPLSHRIIEKRRRDRMNNCLADLSRLLPSEYMKKGRGRIEKTEIIEMAIKHMKHLQSHPCTEGACCPVSLDQSEEAKTTPLVAEHYKLGFHECLSETMHFLVEVEGFFAGDTLCVQLISHLHRHCDNILKGDRLGGGPITQVKEENDPEKISESSSPQSVHHQQQSGHLTSQCDTSTNTGIPYVRNDCDESDRVTGLVGPGESPGSGGGGAEDRCSDNYNQDVLHTSANNNNNNNNTERCSPREDRGGESLLHQQHRSYKFKNSIRKRFATEEHHTYVGGGGLLLQRPAPALVNHHSSSNHHPRLIPVFALSPRGSYYVPLTLDYSLVASQLSVSVQQHQQPTAHHHRGDEMMEEDDVDEVVLHPVTISVNFRPTKLRRDFAHQPPTT